MNDEQRDHVITLTDALVATVRRDLSGCTSPAETYPRIYAAAGLSRGAELLGAGVACLRAGRPEAVGVLIRAAIDTWFVALYLFKGGPSALAELEQELTRNQRVLAQRNGIDALDELLEQRRTDLHRAVDDVGLLEGAAKLDKPTVEMIASKLATSTSRNSTRSSATSCSTGPTPLWMHTASLRSNVGPTPVTSNVSDCATPCRG